MKTKHTETLREAVQPGEGHGYKAGSVDDEWRRMTRWVGGGGGRGLGGYGARLWGAVIGFLISYGTCSTEAHPRVAHTLTLMTIMQG